MVRTTGTRLPVKGRKMMDLDEVRLHGPHGSFQKSESRKWPNTIFTARCVLLEVRCTSSDTGCEVSMCMSSASNIPDRPEWSGRYPMYIVGVVAGGHAPRLPREGQGWMTAPAFPPGVLQGLSQGERTQSHELRCQGTLHVCVRAPVSSVRHLRRAPLPQSGVCVRAPANLPPAYADGGVRSAIWIHQGIMGTCAP